MTDKLSMFIPLAKVDLEKREVWGRATQEIFDGHGEIMDFDSSVPYFKRWSALFEKRTGGKSKGNLRAMHQPIAAGKLIAIDFNETEKAIDIGTYVSDDAEWKKVQDGVYTGFSIGGDYAKRWMDTGASGKTRYTADPHEISLVDMPAVSTATFELVKMGGQIEQREFQKNLSGTSSVPIEIEFEEDLAKSHQLEPGVQAEDVAIEQGSTEGALLPTEPVIVEILSNATVSQISNPATFVADRSNGVAPIGQEQTVVPMTKNQEQEPDWVTDFKEVAKQLSANITKLETIRDNEASELEKNLSVLKLRSSRVGIARREGEPLTANENISSDWMKYGDPVNYKYPVAKGYAYTTIVDYNLRKGVTNYTAREWNIIGRRVTRLASETFGEMYKFNPTSQKVEIVKEKKPMSTDMNKSANPMDLLMEAKKQLNAACEMVGTDPSAAKDLLMQVMAAMDVAGDLSTANPATGASPKLGGAEASVANAMPVGEVAKAVEPAVAEVAKAADAVVPEVAKAVEPVDETKEEGESDLEKALKTALAPMLEIINKQAEAISALQKTNDNPYVAPPAGDLNAVAPVGDVEGFNKDLLDAMNEGNLQKAYATVNNNSNELFEQVNGMAIQSLVKQGINVQKWMVIPSLEPV